MAAKNLITLAPRCVTRTSVALTGQMKIGSPAAFGRPAAFRFFPQGSSTQVLRSGYEPGTRQDHAGNPNVDTAVVGAGRLLGRAGLLRCLGLALSARPATQRGWPAVKTAWDSRPGVMPAGLARTAATRGDRA